VEIEVKLYGQLRRYRPANVPGAPHHPFRFSVAVGSTAVSVATQLGIPDGLINAISLNGETADPHTPLKVNDQLGLFPPSAGGSKKVNS
jgi:hypothetical protein